MGVLLLVGGLAMLGYVGWQLYGTNYVSRQQQTEAVEEVQQRWEQQTTVTADRAADDATPKDGATALIRIPRFGADYVMPVFEGTSEEVLAKGYGHFDHAAGPGEKGNYALAAHRVTHGEPLRDMPSLEPGDEVVVETGRWVYTYVLDTPGDGLTVPFTGAWVLADLPRNPEAGGVQPPDRAPRAATRHADHLLRALPHR